MSNSFDDWLELAAKHKGIQDALAKGLPVFAVRPDPDLSGATVGQAQLLIQGVPGWTPEMTDQYTIPMNVVAMKLTALRYHLRRYRSLQAERFSQIAENPVVLEFLEKGLKLCESEMLFEVEAMFLQYKSTLDMLVKILAVVLGKSYGNFSTYGRNGADLIPPLQRAKDNKKLALTGGRVDELIRLIESAKSPWLESVIRIRDTFSHFGTDISFGFAWNADSHVVEYPSFSTPSGPQQFDVIMEGLINTLIGYCTEFIAWATSCRIPLQQGLAQLSDNEKEWLSARWNMDLSRANWWLDRGFIKEYTAEDIDKAREKARAEGL